MPRTLTIALVAVALAAAATGAAFVFGTPQSPPVPTAISGPASAPGAGPTPGAAGPGEPASTPGGPSTSPLGGELIADGEVPAPDPESPFTFQIPGCRCHSDDPAVVEEHATYRLNQCAGCHRGR